MTELLPDVRKDPKMLDALRRIAPGTTMRQGLNDILRARLGALIVIGEPAELSFLFSGGIRLDQAFSPYLLYELAKMDGAIILNAVASRIVYANVQLMPDPTIPSAETGTRHRTAERVAKQTGALVISISQQRDVVTIYVGDVRYQLEEISDVLAKTNQAVTTLETYRTRLRAGVDPPHGARVPGRGDARRRPGRAAAGRDDDRAWSTRSSATSSSSASRAG